MIRRYIPVDQKNKKRVWPFLAASGAIVHIPSDRVTFTHEDLSGWVEAGVLRELPPVDPPADVIAEPLAADVSLEAEAPATPVIQGDDHSFEVQEGEKIPEADSASTAADLSREGLETLAKSDLWVMLQERGYDGPLSYRKSSKSDLIDAIFGDEAE